MTMRHDTRIQLVALAVGLASFIASGLIALELTASVGRNKLGYEDRFEDNDPPEIALGIALGAFRGVFVNYLWIRANDLKEAGRYHEARDLAEAITKLQPRFPRVWSFHAWNMSYNISVTTQTQEERWYWVQQGIRLIRDQGIPNNDNDLILHKEIGWLFLHKIQGYTDDANPYYKRMVAREWQIILGPPPRPDPLSRDTRVATQRYVDWFSSVAQAPETLEEAIRIEPRVRELVERIRRDLETEPDLTLLRRYEYGRAAMESAEWPVMKANLDERSRRLEACMTDPALQRAWEVLLAHVRKRVIRDEYHMEPQRMLDYTRKYGPLDWRHPCAHAIYWAARGVERALTKVDALTWRDFDFVNTDRIVVHGIQELFRSGEIYFDIRHMDYVTMVNPHYIDQYGEVLRELIDRSPFDREDRSLRPYVAGYQNFMIDAIIFNYRRGDRDRADRMYEELATARWIDTYDPGRVERFSRTLDEFVEAELIERYTSPSVARQELQGSLDAAYIQGLLAGDRDLFDSRFGFARDVHAYFMENQRKVNALDPDLSRMDVIHPDFRVEAGTRFQLWIMNLDVEFAERLYDGAPNDLKLYAYDALASQYRATFDEQARQGIGRNFDDVFPPPEGLVAFRAAEAERRAQENARSITTEQR